MIRRARKKLSTIAKSSKPLATREPDPEVPGPSTNPATNLLITDVALRAAALALRRSAEKGLLRQRFDQTLAENAVKGRSKSSILLSIAASRIAARSVPGFLAVSGSLLAKTVYDRGRDKRKSRREGLKQLAEDAKRGREDD